MDFWSLLGVEKLNTDVKWVTMQMKTKAMQYFSDFTYIIETNTEPTFTFSNSTIETLVYEHFTLGGD